MSNYAMLKEYIELAEENIERAKVIADEICITTRGITSMLASAVYYMANCLLDICTVLRHILAQLQNEPIGPGGNEDELNP